MLWRSDSATSLYVWPLEASVSSYLIPAHYVSQAWPIVGSLVCGNPNGLWGERGRHAESVGRWETNLIRIRSSCKIFCPGWLQPLINNFASYNLPEPLVVLFNLLQWGGIDLSLVFLHRHVVSVVVSFHALQRCTVKKWKNKAGTDLPPIRVKDSRQTPLCYSCTVLQLEIWFLLVTNWFQLQGKNCCYIHCH